MVKTDMKLQSSNVKVGENVKLIVGEKLILTDCEKGINLQSRLIPNNMTYSITE